MKITKIFAAALAATALLASCAQEDGGKNQTGNGETTYAGVNITLPATATRVDDAAAGIDGEKAITSIGIYIVDTATDRLDYEVLDVATDFTESTVATQQVYTATTAVATVTGNKKIFVVANPTTNLENKLQASGTTAMNAVAFGSPKADFFTGTISSMVMTGAYTETGGVFDMSTPLTETEAVAAPVAITIGRNLSKAVVQEAQTYTVIGGTTTLSWTLVNEAKDAHFIKQANTLYSAVSTEAANDDTDLYWSNFSGMTGVDYISVLPKGTEDAKTAAYADSKYMFENMPATFYEGNTTAARIKGVFVPTTVYSDVVAGAPVVDGGFAANDTFLRSTIDGSYWTVAGATAAVTEGYNGHTSSDDFLTYTNGVGYYTIYVNDGSNNGVLRNGYYLMQIDEVRGPGKPTEPTDPIVPIAEDTNLGVKITVLNWDFMKSIQDIQ